MDNKISMFTRWNQQVHQEHDLKQRTSLSFCQKCKMARIQKGTGAWDCF